MFPDLPQTEAVIVEMTNAFRKTGSLQQLKPNPALTAAARAFAGYLAKSGKLAHEADGREPAQRAKAQGYRYCLVAENLARNFNSRGYEARDLAREVVEGWKTSPGHRENLLLAGATEIGVAVARAPGDSPAFVSVQLFGRPESLTVTFTVENRTAKATTYSLGTQTDRIAPRETVTHADCLPRALSVDRGSDGPVHFNPSNGDRFVIRPGASRGIEVLNERRK
jgi:Cysteine-rich secretory protein family